MLNPKLERMHRLISSAYFFFAGLGLLLILADLFQGESDRSGFGLVCLLVIGPVGLFHWYAARGARAGTRWGRNMSRGIGILMLPGFPIWTVLGIYLLTQTGGNWQAGDLPDA